jgi:hypothetical protein
MCTAKLQNPLPFVPTRKDYESLWREEKQYSRQINKSYFSCWENLESKFENLETAAVFNESFLFVTASPSEAVLTGFCIYE